MRVVEVITNAGNDNNEDLIKYDKNYVLLLDGSTSLRENLIKGYPSDAIWFVKVVSKYIEKKLNRILI